MADELDTLARRVAKLSSLVDGLVAHVGQLTEAVAGSSENVARLADTVASRAATSARLVELWEQQPAAGRCSLGDVLAAVDDAQALLESIGGAGATGPT